MDFSRLQHLNLDFKGSNSNLTSLPSVLMEALIPGYGIVSQIILRFFGLDIGLVVSGCVVLFGLVHGGQFLYNKVFGYILSYFSSTVFIEDDDRLYGQIMDWLAEQQMTKESRGLKAVTKWINAYHDDDDDEDVDDEYVLDENGLFNFEKWASRVPLRYEPYYGRDRFFHNGRWFTFNREQKETKKSPWANSEDEFLAISCLGRDTEPIKDFLNHVKSWTLEKENQMTVVFRPAPKEGGGEREWDRQSCRPSRPISTVSLDRQQKANIVNDINEYLHPATARWYAARGIPYRRGYLFHGPPGTGKTSLSFSLAGIFGLDIYCISLNEVGLTESDLAQLFSNLPRRCVVLLEDIDSAGLRRPDLPTNTDDDDSSSTELVNGDTTSVPIPESAHMDPSKTTVSTKSLISLAGLLNIIDGAASHEGRVLIMTTNCPESLDAALIRPGRVDLQVGFTLATRDQIQDIYERMYSMEIDERDAPKAAGSGANKETKTSKRAISSSSTKLSTHTRKQDEDLIADLLSRDRMQDVVEPEKLAEMARQFAEQLPERVFSPAEIQGFLLIKKRDPFKAVEDVGRWRDSLLEAKKQGKKVVRTP